MVDEYWKKNVNKLLDLLRTDQVYKEKMSNMYETIGESAVFYSGDDRNTSDTVHLCTCSKCCYVELDPDETGEY
jgi:hypothetical protein